MTNEPLNQNNMKTKITFTIILSLIINLSNAQIDTALKASQLSEFLLEDLMNIKMISASGTVQKISDIPASVVLITRKEIEQRGYKDLNEILENIPGFYSLGNAYNEGGTNFGVRGFSSGGALADFMIMVNGVSQIQDFSNSFSTDRIIVPVEAIEKIEVVRGPNAVIYGSSAFMGAVNIITNDIADDNKNIISAAGGNYDTYKASAHIAGKKNDLSFVFNAGIKNSSGLDAKYSDMQSDTNIIKSWGLPANATTRGQFNGTQKYFELSSKYKGFKFSLISSDDKQGTMGSKPSANKETGFVLTTLNTIISAGYERELGKKVKINSKLYYYNFDQTGDPHFNYANSYNLFNTKSKGYEVEVSGNFNFNKIDFIIGLNNHTTLEAGRNLDFTTSPVTFRNFHYFINENDNQVTNSAFAQLNFRPVEKLLFVAGLRAERTDPFEMTANYDYTINTATAKDTTVVLNIGTINYNEIQYIPRAAAIYKITENNVLKLMFGQSKKRPSILESVNIGSRNLNDLEYAEMQTFELNYTTVISKNYLVSLNVFYNDLKNLVLRHVAVSSTGAIITQSANAGKTNTYGAELSTKLNFTKNFSFDLSLVYQQTTNNSDGYPTEGSYSPAILGYCYINYRFKKLDFCLNGRYVDKIKPGWNINTDPSKSVWYGKDVDAYSVLNFNLRANDLWKGIFVSFNISNIFDTQIHYPSTPNSTWTDKGMLALGRTFLVNLGIKF